MKETGKVLFLLTDDALIAANSGERFTREGVISVCHMHLGKGAKKPTDDFGNKLIPGIKQRMIDIYGISHHLVAEQANDEKELSGDYNGRSVLELLQNADDAATLSALGGAPSPGDLIGAKGVGFKSVLEISESPEIYSGEFRFRFSREDTRAALDQAKVEADSGVPVFRIPHECEPGPECMALLKDGHSTVIRLPFGDDRAKNMENARQRLKELDATCLLFCQRLSLIEIQFEDGQKRVLEIARNGAYGFNNGAANFTLTENGVFHKWRRWSAVWTPPGAKTPRSAALCLPVDGESGNAECMDKERPVHVFFPTAADASVPNLKALLHATYDLENNREHFKKEQSHDEAIRAKVGELTAVILKEIPPGAALRAFGEIPRAKDDETKSEIERLQNVFADTVANTNFVPTIGGGLVKPSEARLWNHGLGGVLNADAPEVSAACLLDSSLACDQHAPGILRGLNAKSIGLSEHAELLRHCKNDSPKACAMALQVAEDIAAACSDPKHYLEKDAIHIALKNAPFWWTDNKSNSPIRALTSDIPLLWHRPDDWPEWLPADALSPEFTDGIRDDDFKAMKNAMGKDWPLDEFRRYFWDVLIPFCRGKSSEWWEELGEHVIQWVLKWGGENFGGKKIYVSVINESEGSKIGEVIHLPTNKGWLPAIHCYFGPAWGGREYYGKAEGTGVVRPPNEWGAKNSFEWRQMLFWLGVWNVPKEYRVGTELRIHRPALEALMRFAKPEELLSDVCEMARIFGENSATFRQLQQEELIPCRPGIFHPDARRVKPGEAYMPGCGIKGYFPEVEIPGDLDEKMKEWLPCLGVRKSLPSSEEDREWWGKCMSDLAKEAQRRGDDSEDLLWEKGELAEAIRELYEKFDASLDGMGDVPYLRHESNGVFVAFAPQGDVRWMNIKCDKDYPAVYREILAEFRNIFPFHLEKGENFRLTPVSDNLEWLHRLAGKCESARLRWAGEKSGDVARFIRKWYSELHRNASGGGADNVPYLRQESNRKVFVDFAPKDDVYWMDMKCHKDPAVYGDILEAFSIFPPQLGDGSRFELTSLSASNMEWLHKVVKNVGNNSPNRLRWGKDEMGDVAKFIDILYRSNKYGAPPVGAAFAPFLRQRKNDCFVGFAAADEVRWADMPEYDHPTVKRALLSNDRFKILPWFLNSGESFGIDPLSTSGKIQRSFDPGQDVPDKAEKLWRRYYEREMAFVLLGGDNGKRLLRENLRACSSLRLVLRDMDNNIIVKSPIDAFVNGQEVFVNMARPHWRAFADGLGQWMEKLKWRMEFRGFLSAERREDWIYDLRMHGISEDQLSPLEEAEQPHDPTSTEVAPTPVVSAPPDTAQAPPTASPGAAVASPPSSAPTHHAPAGQPAAPSPRSPSSNLSVSTSTGRTRTRSSSPPRPPTPTPPWTPSETTTPTPRPEQATRQPSESKHKALQDEIHQHPEKIGLPGAEVSYYQFPSGDKVDLLLSTADEYVAVEVKTHDCSPAEIERGAYQCVKYDSLLKAAIEFGALPPKKGRTIFALGGRFPAGMERVWKFLKDREIEIRESLSAPAPS